MTVEKKVFKICVSSMGETLGSEIDPRFGRCKHFLLLKVDDDKKLNVELIENVGAKESSGAGIKAAEQIGNLAVDVLITGDVGPKAGDILNRLDIKVVKTSGIIDSAVNEYIEKGNLVSEKNVSDSETKEKELSVNNLEQKMFIPLMNNDGENSEISLHFGHAPFFGLYDLTSKELIIKKNDLDHGDPSKSPVDQIVEKVNPTIVFAQDMGMRAVNLFVEKNIKLKTGQFKTVKEVIDSIDDLVDLTKGCEH